MPRSFEPEITTLSDGVEYRFEGEHETTIKVTGKPTRASVRVTINEASIAPASGNLDSEPFREKLSENVAEKLGEANGFAGRLDAVAVRYPEDLEQRGKDAAEDDEKTNVPELVGTPYRIVNGGFVRLKSTREGEIPQRLTNFTARVAEEVVKDDGAETRRTYRVAGEAEDRKLPTAEVPAARFGSMNWVSEAWGLSARITAGQGTKDYAREAIELLSHGGTTRRLYAHTGFRELPGGERVYLHAGGAVGAKGVEVELEPGLERYALPALDDSKGSAAREELAAAVRCSLSFLQIAPERITGPLLGAAYLAPLSEIVVPDFTLWPWGATGSFKSTIAALLLSHFGARFSETSLPLSFESTSNALERSLFLLKDTVAVVDDWRPAVSRGDASEMDRKAQRLLRAVGNRQGRGRMTSETTLRRSYSPRGLVIATAEALPEGPAFESAAARALSINLSREDVDLGGLSKLQRNKAALSHAMRGYVEWVALRYEELSRELPAHQDGLRNRLRPELAGSHPRTPDATAGLITGLTALEAYAKSVGALDEKSGKELLSRASAGVVEAAKAHTEATKGGDPATRFIGLLRSLFAAGKAYAKDREKGTHPDDWADLGWERRETQDGGDVIPERGAEFVGWADDEYLYLDREAAYTAVAAYAQRGGIPFGVKPRALWGALKRAGMSRTDANRADTTARICGRTRRVVQVPRESVFGGGHGDD